MATATTLFVSMIVHIIFVVILGASTYGLGIEQGDKTSSLYKFAESGTIISAIGLFITLSIFAYSGLDKS